MRYTLSCLAILLTISCGTPPETVAVGVGQSANSKAVYKGKTGDTGSASGTTEGGDATDGGGDAASSTSAVSSANTASAHADDIDLLQDWKRGEYLGNEDFKVAFLPSLEFK